MFAKKEGLGARSHLPSPSLSVDASIDAGPDTGGDSARGLSWRGRGQTRMKGVLAKIRWKRACVGKQAECSLLVLSLPNSPFGTVLTGVWQSAVVISVEGFFRLVIFVPSYASVFFSIPGTVFSRPGGQAKGR